MRVMDPTLAQTTGSHLRYYKILIKCYDLPFVLRIRWAVQG